MTILHSGASGKFASNWLKIFGPSKSSERAKATSRSDKEGTGSPPVKPNKKSASRKAAKSAKKKPSGKGPRRSRA